MHLNKCSKRMIMLRKFKYRWSRWALERSYLSFVWPVIEYGDIIQDNCSIADSDKIESMQLKTARMVIMVKRGKLREALYQELGWLKLCERRKIHKLIETYCIISYFIPQCQCNIYNSYRLRGNDATKAQLNKESSNHPNKK